MAYALSMKRRSLPDVDQESKQIKVEKSQILDRISRGRTDHVVDLLRLQIIDNYAKKDESQA